MSNVWTFVKRLPVLLVTCMMSLQACGLDDSKDGASASSSECGFDGTRLPTAHDLGFNNPIDCMSIERSDRADNHHLGLSLWASKSRVMPKMFFPVNSTSEIVPGEDYSTNSTTTVTAENEPKETVELPSAMVHFTAVGSKNGEVSSGTILIEAKSGEDGKTWNAKINFEIPTEVRN